MPLISIKTSEGLEYDCNDLSSKLSQEISLLTGKPEKYVMTIVENNIKMYFGSSNAPCCYIEVKSIGLIFLPFISTVKIGKIPSLSVNFIQINIILFNITSP